jgi:hypothetical protein
MSIESLWGEIPKADDIKTPIAILREQAAILGDATNNVLVAEVVPNKRGSTMLAHLYIAAPALDNYRFLVLTVEHELELYPLSVEDETSLYDNCKDETQYKAAVRAILSSDRLRRVIASLLAQSKQA